MSAVLIPLQKSRAASEVTYQNSELTIDYLNPPGPTYRDAQDSILARDEWINEQVGFSNLSWRDEIADATSAGTSYRRSCVRDVYARGGFHYTQDFLAGPNGVHTLTKQSTRFLEYPYSSHIGISGGGDPQLVFPTDCSAGSVAATRFYNKVADVVRPFTGAVFAGEFEDTLTLGLHPLKTFTELSRELIDAVAILRRRRLPRRRLTKALANAWLEYRLGVLPLLSDAKGYASAYERLVHGINRVYHCTGVGRYTEPAVFQELYGRTWLGYPATGHIYTKRHFGVRMMGGVYAGCEPSHNPLTAEKSAETLGLSIREFFPTVYEMIPYSFVVDYFYNFGNLLTAACYQNVKLVWAITCYQSRVDNEKLIVLSPRTYTSPTTTTHIEGLQQGSWSKFQFQRAVGAIEVPRMPTVRLPSPIQATTIAALMRQLISIG